MDLCQRIGEAITEIELRRVATPSSEVTIGLPRYPCLLCRDWLNDNIGLLQQLV